ncbi:hypothetical protein OEZ85_012268 [Tetradesmus obliquus]|uniref:Uncharacterized protein n=1 Tax=Tetradesmus obliquus TaxID=3088 RepID=A0ABY8TXK4_TETOB|nr:hypothetical protein OEZ85_012268 [Tetradesmus obliquus]
MTVLATAAGTGGLEALVRLLGDEEHMESACCLFRCMCSRSWAARQRVAEHMAACGIELLAEAFDCGCDDVHGATNLQARTMELMKYALASNEAAETIAAEFAAAAGSISRLVSFLRHGTAAAELAASVTAAAIAAPLVLMLDGSEAETAMSLLSMLAGHNNEAAMEIAAHLSIDGGAHHLAKSLCREEGAVDLLFTMLREIEFGEEAIQKLASRLAAAGGIRPLVLRMRSGVGNLAAYCLRVLAVHSSAAADAGELLADMDGSHHGSDHIRRAAKLLEHIAEHSSSTATALVVDRMKANGGVACMARALDKSTDRTAQASMARTLRHLASYASTVDEVLPAVQALTELLCDRDGDPGCQFAAAGALWRVAASTSCSSSGLLRECVQPMCSALASSTCSGESKAQTALAVGAAVGSASDRALSISLAQAVAGPLIALLSDGKDTVKEAAARALGYAAGRSKGSAAAVAEAGALSSLAVLRSPSPEQTIAPSWTCGKVVAASMDDKPTKCFLRVANRLVDVLVADDITTLQGFLEKLQGMLDENPTDVGVALGVKAVQQVMDEKVNVGDAAELDTFVNASSDAFAVNAGTDTEAMLAPTNADVFENASNSTFAVNANANAARTAATTSARIGKAASALQVAANAVRKQRWDTVQLMQTPVKQGSLMMQRLGRAFGKKYRMPWAGRTKVDRSSAAFTQRVEPSKYCRDVVMGLLAGKAPNFTGKCILCRQPAQFAGVTDPSPMYCEQHKGSPKSPNMADDMKHFFERLHLQPSTYQELCKSRYLSLDHDTEGHIRRSIEELNTASVAAAVVCAIDAFVAEWDPTQVEEAKALRDGHHFSMQINNQGIHAQFGSYIAKQITKSRRKPSFPASKLAHWDACWTTLQSHCTSWHLKPPPPPAASGEHQDF